MILKMAREKNLNVVIQNSSEFYFPHWIHDHLDHNGDLQALGITSEMEGLARKMVLVGLRCIQTTPKDRLSNLAVHVFPAIYALYNTY